MRKRLQCLICIALLLISGCAPLSSSGQTPDSTTTTGTSALSTIITTTTNADSSVTTDATTPSSSVTATETNNTTSSTTVSITQSKSTANTTKTHTTIASTTTSSFEQVTFKATVRENSNNKTVENVIVTVYTDDNNTPIGSAKTDANGIALIVLPKADSYRVVLSNLPAGYEANADYRFTSTVVNITIRKAAVQNELDHSNAQYEVGKKMTDFALTDIDGNTYRLSALLKEKKLVVLDFWYTTCAPCKMEFPYFESAVQKYGDEFSLLAINPINDNAAMKALRQQLNSQPSTAISFPMLKDSCKLHLGFGVTSYPVTVFIDSNGIIMDIHHGAYTNEKAFLAAVERFLQ